MTRYTTALLIPLVACAIGCGSAERSSSGSGGSTASGGVIATGGAVNSASGGVAATGGSVNGMSGGVSAGGSVNSTSGGVTAMGGSVDGTGGAVTGAGGSAALGCTDFQTPTKVGDIAESALDGPSGIAASRAYPGVLYAHLDAGGGPVVYAMTYAGKALAAYTFTGMTATDWEDIAVGPCESGSCIYVGDIGDNAARTGGTPRSQIQVLRVDEPAITMTQTAVQQSLSAVTVLRFTYPDMPHDAETLMVDPVTRDILIVTKETDGNSSIFRAPANTPANTPSVLEKVGNVQIGASGQAAQASAGDVSPNGDRFVVRSYTAVLSWPRAASFAATFAATPKTLAWSGETQGEGVTFTADGKAWLLAGERSRAIYQSACQ